MNWGLKVVEEWCREWAVEVNVEKSGVVYMRRGIREDWRGLLCEW